MEINLERYRKNKKNSFEDVILIDKEEIHLTVYEKNKDGVHNTKHIEINKYKTKVNVTNISLSYVAIRVQLFHLFINIYR